MNYLNLDASTIQAETAQEISHANLELMSLDPYLSLQEPHFPLYVVSSPLPPYLLFLTRIKDAYITLILTTKIKQALLPTTYTD